MATVGTLHTRLWGFNPWECEAISFIWLNMQGDTLTNTLLKATAATYLLKAVLWYILCYINEVWFCLNWWSLLWSTSAFIVFLFACISHYVANTEIYIYPALLASVVRTNLQIQSLSVCLLSTVLWLLCCIREFLCCCWTLEGVQRFSFSFSSDQQKVYKSL